MQNLWNGLTGGGAEARSAISQHLLVTVDVLIKDTTSKLWRTRLGACGALSQVIVGRSWAELGGGPAVLFDDENPFEYAQASLLVSLLEQGERP